LDNKNYNEFLEKLKINQEITDKGKIIEKRYEAMLLLFVHKNTT
jgi:hypothetical protein